MLDLNFLKLATYYIKRTGQECARRFRLRKGSGPWRAGPKLLNNNEKRFFLFVIRIHLQMISMLFGSRTVCDYNCRVISKATGSASGCNKEAALAQTNVRWQVMMEYQRVMMEYQVPIATLAPGTDHTSNCMEENE